MRVYAHSCNCRALCFGPVVSSVPNAGKKWWRRSGVDIGKSTAKIQLGNDATKKGEKYKVVAMTTEKPLAQQTYLNLPDCRTRSKEITLIRR